ncbi:hypothetical protein ZIOFF_067831 [Zingiber officinale]|uniref:SUN domain-containing protein n=1 Tax=Zingiber officinale TaxID=94328 RepID=A0A8J5EVI6_ZINOF|nr:hypothetical protein ZIOFF_067831 [Zingiber officinale]
MPASTSAGVAAASPVANTSVSLGLDANGKPNSRRRTMVAVEKRLTADGLSKGGTNGVLNGKDLNHTVRRETVVERTKDYSTLRKGLVASPTVSPQRKKLVRKPEKSKWQIVLSILTKNCLLLASLLWLGQTIWRWTHSTGENANTALAALEYESRISEVETSLKKTAKMLQIQLDVVDKKIGSEISITTKEIFKQVKNKGAFFEEQLKKLESKADSLGKSLSELNELDLISREDFEKLILELKNSKNMDDTSMIFDLDQIRAFASDIVQKEIDKHAADGLGRVDYALASGGTKVVRHSTPYCLGKGSNWFTSATGRNGVHANSHKMLSPSFGEPGQCFSLQGSSGFVEIRLRTGIIPEAVTLEHVSKVLHEASIYARATKVLEILLTSPGLGTWKLSSKCELGLWGNAGSSWRKQAQNMDWVVCLEGMPKTPDRVNVLEERVVTQEGSMEEIRDSGASHNFISPQLTVALRLKVHETRKLGIKLGDGHKVFAKGKCPDPGSFLLKTLGKVVMDWKEMTMQFLHEDLLVILQAEGVPSQTTLPPESELNASQQLELSQLLERFSAVFKEGSRLPPTRRFPTKLNLTVDLLKAESTRATASAGTEVVATGVRAEKSRSTAAARVLGQRSKGRSPRGGEDQDVARSAVALCRTRRGEDLPSGLEVTHGDDVEPEYVIANRNIVHNGEVISQWLVKWKDKDMIDTTSSAPKDCRVSGWFESPDDDLSSNAKKISILTEFSYDLEKSNAQTYNIETTDCGVVNMVRFDFTSNHGNSALTCIYRFRVHGYELSSPATMH